MSAQNTGYTAAWQFDPYRVRVWVLHDQSAMLRAWEQHIAAHLASYCTVLESSAWQLTVEPAPLEWSNRLRETAPADTTTSGLASVLETLGADKLILVRIKQSGSDYELSARELDYRTQVWGPLVTETTGQLDRIGRVAGSITCQAFMPLARVERVGEETARIRLRAAGLAIVGQTDDQGVFRVAANTKSPVRLKSNDVLLPVTRRVNQRGLLESIKPVEWTYLLPQPHEPSEVPASAVSEIQTESGDAGDSQVSSAKAEDIESNEGDANAGGQPASEEAQREIELQSLDLEQSRWDCRVVSMQRTPLGGRSGRFIERLALVVRPDDRPTRLKLVSSDSSRKPLAGVEVSVYSVNDDKFVLSTVLGKTDWRGMIEVPHSDEAVLRMILIRSGVRALAQVPVVPGLLDVVEAPMPNDEIRLYAEGIARGLANEMLDLLARRTVLAEEIKRLVRANDIATADKVASVLQDMPDSDTFVQKLLNEEKNLQSQDRREAEKIHAMFEDMRKLSGMYLLSGLKAEMIRLIQGGPAALKALEDKEKAEAEELPEDAGADGSSRPAPPAETVHPAGGSSEPPADRPDETPVPDGPR